MKSLHLLFAAIVFVSVSTVSCKKIETPDPLEKPEIFKIKTYMEEYIKPGYHTFDTANFSYDSDNRVTAIVTTGWAATYIYNSDNTVLISLTGVLYLKELRYKYFLNGNNNVDSSSGYYPGTEDSTTEKYLYDNDRLTERREYSYSPTTNVSTLLNRYEYGYDANNNVISEQQFDGSDNTLLTSATYTYKPQQLNFNLLPLYVPVLSRQLVANRTTIYYDPSLIVTRSISSEYTFDNEGRVVQQIDLFTDTLNDNYTVKRTYIY